MDNNNNKKPINKWIQLISIPAQMGVVIFAFAYLGQWLDGYLKYEYLFTIILSLLGVAISFYSVIKNLNKINKND